MTELNASYSSIVYFMSTTALLEMLHGIVWSRHATYEEENYVRAERSINQQLKSMRTKNASTN